MFCQFPFNSHLLSWVNLGIINHKTKRSHRSKESILSLDKNHRQLGGNNMKTKKIIPVIFFCLLISLSFTSVFAVQVPTREEDIPIYPGALEHKDEVDKLRIEGGTLFREEFADLVLLSRSVKLYGVNATFTQAQNFYVGKMGGTKVGWDFNVPVDPKNKIYYYVNVWGTDFIWYVNEANGDLTRFTIILRDGSGLSSHPKLAVTIYRETYTGKDKVKIIVPTEKDLGGPVYPGSTYEPNESYWNELLTCHVFYSKDPPAKVIAFYENALKLKPLKGEPSPGKENYLFQRVLMDYTNYIVIEESNERLGKTKITFNKGRE